MTGFYFPHELRRNFIMSTERTYVIMKTPVYKVDSKVVVSGETVIENLNLWERHEAETIINTLNLMWGNRYIFTFKKLVDD